jgi:hypothetical protein
VRQRINRYFGQLIVVAADLGSPVTKQEPKV